MDDKPTKRGGGALAVIMLVGVLVVLPALYVLSVGPVDWLCDNGQVPQSWEPAITAIYAPLNWLDENVPIARQALRYYVSWWQPHTAPAGS